LYSGQLRRPAFLRLAWRAKRARNWPAAIALWEEAFDAGEIEALRELAMHHEHSARDYTAALLAAKRGVLLLTAAGDDLRLRRLIDGFRRRRQRIERKIAGGGSHPAREART
jgi:hypothetical protein